MERLLAQIFESILSKLGESFLSKVADHTADNALNNMKSIKDFELILKALQKKLKSLSAKAADVEEEIKNAELSGRKKRKRQVEEWLGEVKSIEREVVEFGSQVESEEFIMRLMDGGKPAQLNDEVDKLVEQSRNFGELVLDVCGTSGDTFLINGLVGEAFIDNLERILILLETRQVSSIGVCGMGGVGKTTLAKHINNQLLKQSQGHVFWIIVSQEFTIKSLQDKIARFLGLDLSDEDEEDLRATRLHRALSQLKNSVLILDDVWENIDMLKVGCPVSLECCRLIITTRSLEVCRQIRCQKVIRVEELREDEAWRLFNETLGNEIKLVPQVEEIAKSLVKLCGGLPLGIITVAGGMRGETSIYTWKNALIELKEHVLGQDGMGDDEIFKVLKYSFDRLKRNNQSHSKEFNTFQLCFLYCSLYPEDEEIHRENLVRKFISEGLMDERKSRKAQVEQGHSVLDKLVNVCLLESRVDDFDHKCVKMHDLVRCLAVKIGEGKYMVRSGDYSLMEIPDEQEWTKGLEQVSLMKSVIGRIRDGISPNCPNLSTLLLRENPLHFIPDSFFSKMQGLCTLDLSETHIRMVPDSICDMKSLKALLLEYCRELAYVPNLGNLKALRELNLSGTAIKEVPQGLEELLNLKFLSMNAHLLKMLPRGLLLKLGHLQHVNLPVYIQVPFEEIENLKLLEEFSGGVKSVNDFNCFITSRVHDTCYTIGVGSHDTTCYKRGGSFNNELILCGCNLKDEKVLGQDVVYLRIRECEGMTTCLLDLFTRSNYPTCLKKLDIERCGGIECILRSEQELPSLISALEEIELMELEDLKGVVIEKGEIGIGAPVVPSAQPVFSTLTRLRVEKCNKMRKLGLPVLGFPNLEFVEIGLCGEIEEIFEDEGTGSLTLPKLRQLRLFELPRLRKVGLLVLGVPNLEDIGIEWCGEIEEIFEDEGTGSINLPKLERLWLYGLPRLKSVCKATLICNSIVEIDIRKCPRLMKKLPVHVDVTPPPTLVDIFVEFEWWETLEWDNPNLPLLLHPLVNFLDW